MPVCVVVEEMDTRSYRHTIKIILQITGFIQTNEKRSSLSLFPNES